MCIRDSRGTDGRSAGDLMGNSVTRPCVDRKKPLTRSIIPQPPDDEPKTLPGILDDYGAPTERTVDVDHTDLSSGSGLARAVRNSTFYVAKGLDEEELFEIRGLDTTFESAAEWRQVILQHSCGEPVQVVTADGRVLDAIFIEAKPASRHGAAAIFHPNSATCLDMVAWGLWYYKVCSMSALLVTMGGYAGSEGETTELSSYADAYAAVDFLEHLYAIPRERIVMHGVSIGGALASGAAVSRPGVNCTVDQTFTSAQIMAGNSAQLVSPLLPSWVASSVTARCFPTEVADVRWPGMLTDGYNNLQKAAQIKGYYFVLWARSDHMMPASFAEKLIEAQFEAVVERCQVAENVAGMSDKELKVAMTKLGITHRSSSTLNPAASRAKMEKAVLNAAQNAKLATYTKHFSASMQGDHGSFFGEDPRTSKVYYNYLKNIGCLEVGLLDSWLHTVSLTTSR
eukprot:TRINITY_DN7634_c0_g1_i4.p1 TRINITY_DN7634_c0_g1~~TRINITY_DN7634_c0_g1_i4.p1  ORF type:complete len:455 (+),score=97.56 TRINITY_DN7634_c0_g1_i4:200-1564(+)